MNKFKRIFVIVIDSMGIGNAPDADKFKGDAGADTLGHIAETVEHFHIPHLEKMGIGNLKPMDKVAPAGQPTAYFCPLVEKSAGKDTMTGHW
ncbi:MAG: phosphopentomutase, partial [Butyrivibrio sp.]|nr:phosphopentomutase [Butyrivibrio sp.]